MNEIEKKGIATPSITTIAAKFNGLILDNTVQGMKTASLIERQVIEAERRKEEERANPVIKEEPIPTGHDIRIDREQGEYR